MTSTMGTPKTRNVDSDPAQVVPVYFRWSLCVASVRGADDIHGPYKNYSIFFSKSRAEACWEEERG